MASRTMNLSLGERPVRVPVSATSEPRGAQFGFAAAQGRFNQLWREKIAMHIILSEQLRDLGSLQHRGHNESSFDKAGNARKRTEQSRTKSVQQANKETPQNRCK